MSDIVVFLRSDLGYEEFPRDTIDEALATIKNIRAKALDLDDGIEREIGLWVNKEQSFGFEVEYALPGDDETHVNEYPEAADEDEARQALVSEHPDAEIIDVTRVEYTE